MEILNNSTEQNTGAQLTFFQEDFHASRLVQLEPGKGKMTLVSSGLKCLELSERLGPVSSLAKMLLESQAWKMADYLKGYSLTWSLLGIRSKRFLYQLQVSGPITEEIESGLLPTPNKVDHNRLIMDLGAHYEYLQRDHQINLVSLMQLNGHTPKEIAESYEQVMGYPTGWTELEASETPSSRKSRSKSSKQSKV